MSDDSNDKEDPRLVTRIGSLEIDWPRCVGYFGGVGLAVAFDLIAPPLALFVMAVPLLKLFKRPNANIVERAVAATLEGMAKPVGGDSEGVVRVVDDADTPPQGKPKHDSHAAVVLN